VRGQQGAGKQKELFSFAASHRQMKILSLCSPRLERVSFLPGRVGGEKIFLRCNLFYALFNNGDPGLKWLHWRPREKGLIIPSFFPKPLFFQKMALNLQRESRADLTPFLFITEPSTTP